MVGSLMGRWRVERAACGIGVGGVRGGGGGGYGG